MNVCNKLMSCHFTSCLSFLLSLVYFFLKIFLPPFYLSNLYFTCERKHEVFLSELFLWCLGIAFPMSFPSYRWHWSQSITKELHFSKPHLPWAMLRDPIVFPHSYMCQHPRNIRFCGHFPRILLWERDWGTSM